jgi:hypothetical protein
VTTKSKSVFKRLSASISRWTRRGGAAAPFAADTHDLAGLSTPTSLSCNDMNPGAAGAPGFAAEPAARAITDTPTNTAGASAGRESHRSTADGYSRIRGTALSVRNGMFAAAATMAGGYGI